MRYLLCLALLCSPAFALNVKDSKETWKIEDEFKCQGVLVRCEERLSDSSKAKLEKCLRALPELTAAFAKKHNLKVTGELPQRIIFVSGAVWRGVYNKQRTEWHGLARGLNRTCYVGFSGSGDFKEKTFWHEMAHFFFEEQSDHESEKTTWVADGFADYCKGKVKE